MNKRRGAFAVSAAVAIPIHGLAFAPSVARAADSADTADRNADAPEREVVIEARMFLQLLP